MSNETIVSNYFSELDEVMKKWIVKFISESVSIDQNVMEMLMDCKNIYEKTKQYAKEMAIKYDKIDSKLDKILNRIYMLDERIKKD